MGSMASRRHRVLMAISDLDGGGAERQFSLLLRHLSRDRFEPHVCIWRDTARYQLPDDVPVHMVKKNRWWHVFQAVLGMRRLIDELRPELVYSQLHYVNMVTGTALKLKGHQPRWICRQVNDPRREMPHLFGVWARRALRRCDRVIGCSEGVRQEVVRYLGVPSERTVQLDNLAEIQRIRKESEEPLPIERPEDTFVVVHAGRLQSQKNQAMLLDGFSRLEGKVELWMLGDGPLESDLKERASSLGIASKVRWLGFRENPFPFFRAADCLALTSSYEGLPNVVIEAMSCGTPVVATQCPYGPDELIEDSVTGLLVPMADTEALTCALERLKSDPEKRHEMGRAASESSERRFDRSQPSRAFENLFTSVLGSASSEARSS